MSQDSARHGWWQEGVIYQIYPRSFQDAGGDGVGDLPGVLKRLDHLRWLGVDALWLSPVYPSPMADFGYDVSDYRGIDPLFGSMADFDRLLETAHAKGLKVLMDFVPNHTSDEHPWFAESRASKDNPKRDWYIWRPPAAGGGPPNNWRSEFGGSAWTWDPATGEHYYHAFLDKQPDLNWRNPEVQAAMLDVLRFWLDKGVDGFRIDVIWHVIKDEQFRDNPRNPAWKPGDPAHHDLLATYSTDRPEVHSIIAKMRDLVNSYEGRVLIGEVYLPIERLMTYYGTAGDGLHLPFNFQLLKLPWDAAAITAAIDTYEASLPPGGWPNWVLGNHDNPRLASRVGAAQAPVAAMMLLTLRGTPTLYYGDEIGLEDLEVPPAAQRDPFGLRVPGMGRDRARAPMPWSPGPGNGFTSGSPWLPLPEDADVRNVALQMADPDSLLTLYRRLLALRRAEPALSVGSHRSFPSQGPVMLYERRTARDRLLVALNLSGEARRVRLPEQARGRVLLSSQLRREGDEVAGEMALGADEGLVIRRED
jgi:alpha-glucosidase